MTLSNDSQMTFLEAFDIGKASSERVFIAFLEKISDWVEDEVPRKLILEEIERFILERQR